MAGKTPEIELGSPAFWKDLKKDPSRMAFELCKIDLVDLEKTLQHQPSLTAWIVAAYETARVQEEKAKWELEVEKARALIKMKGTLDSDTGKNKTVAVLNAEVELCGPVIDLTEYLLDCQDTRAALRAIVQGLSDRKDMLIQISARHRQEAKEYS